MIRISTVINLALTLQLSYLRSLLFFTIVRESESYYTPYTSLARERLKGSAADLVQISRSHSSQSTLASRIASKNSLKKEYQNNFSSLTLISSLVSHYRNYFHDLVKRRLPRKRITIQKLH